MKWRKISCLQYDDLQVVKDHLEFLEVLGIDAATSSADDVNSEMEEHFCSECHEIKDDCHCYEDRYSCDMDRAYDAWKDAQLENEDR
jgi:hypothetical protein